MFSNSINEWWPSTIQLMNFPVKAWSLWQYLSGTSSTSTLSSEGCGTVSRVGSGIVQRAMVCVLGKNHLGSTWRIIPFSKWLITMVSFRPLTSLTGVVPFSNGRTSWLINGGDPNYLLTGMILQVPPLTQQGLLGGGFSFKHSLF